MLVSFSVENHLSFKERQTLDLRAESYNDLPDNVISINNYSFDILKTIAIYGPNASGKSNLIEAFSEFVRFLFGNLSTLPQYAQLGEQAPFFPIPFKYIKDKNAPSIFEIEIFLDGILYFYSISFDPKGIKSEKLSFFPFKREALLFSRTREKGPSVAGDIFEGEHFYKFGSQFKGSKKQPVIATKGNIPFLTVINNFNNSIAKKIFKYLNSSFFLLNNLARRYQKISTSISFDNILPSFTIDSLMKDAEYKGRVIQLMKRIDIHIDDIIVESKKAQEFDIYFVRDEVYSHLGEESKGTEDIFFLLRIILGCLDFGGLFIFDEINSSFHSKISRFIVDLFQNPNTNKTNAQLIFTSHDSSLLDQSLFRRDQIYFTEKQVDFSTHLYSLADFNIRKYVDIEKAYKIGKFGAVPYINDLF